MDRHSKKIAILAVIITTFVVCGGASSGQVGNREEVAKHEEAWWEMQRKKDALPHTTPDGKTPEEVRERYLKRVQDGDGEAASEALGLIRSVIEKEDGFYSRLLAEVAIAALRVRPDEDFVRLLVEQVPKESTISADPIYTTSTCDAGESTSVLRTIPGLASRLIIQWLDAHALKADEVALYCYILVDMSRRTPGLSPDWETYEPLVKLSSQYADDEWPQELIWDAIEAAYDAAISAIESTRPIHGHGTFLSDARKLVTAGGDAKLAWGLLSEAVEQQRMERQGLWAHKETVVYFCLDLQQENELVVKPTALAMSDFLGGVRGLSSCAVMLSVPEREAATAAWMTCGVSRTSQKEVQIGARYEDKQEKFVDEVRQSLELWEGNSAVISISDGKTKRFVAVFAVVRPH